MNVKILDCTLRDGGYINNWDFGAVCIREVVSKLIAANIDIIEVGFLDSTYPVSANSTQFPHTDCLSNALPSIPATFSGSLVAMVMLGKCPIENIAPASEVPIDSIRVCFRKQQLEEAVAYSKSIVEKDYKLYWQPASITDYSDADVLRLIEAANKVKPYAIYIVDTYGLMIKSDVIRYYSLFNSNLDEHIALGFHSHNNLQLSFSNALALFDMNPSRDMIIDSSVFGMGRGAGNLCTELLTRYLNTNFGHTYNILSILEIVDEYINPIFKRLPWGYSVAYYVAAINNCHPNYASFLVDKQSVGVKTINSILAQIPDEYKRNYNKELIERLYVENLQTDIDDTNAIATLSHIVNNQKVLVIAPGRTITTHQNEIKRFIEQEKPWVIAINRIPEQYNVDAVFISNLKRFADIEHVSTLPAKHVILTSNLIAQTNTEGAFVVNYSELVYRNTEEADNAGVMVLRLLQKLTMGEVYLVGYDGFHTNPYENYHTDKMRINMPVEIIAEKNRSIAEQLQVIRKHLHFSFLTPSLYTSLMSEDLG